MEFFLRPKAFGTAYFHRKPLALIASMPVNFPPGITPAFAFYFQQLEIPRERCISVFLGIGLNRTVNKFLGARKLLKTGCQQLSTGNALGPKNKLKTIESSRIATGQPINLIYAVDSIMIKVMLRNRKS